MEKIELVISYLSTIFILIVSVTTYIIKLINKTIEIHKMKNKELATKEMIKLIEEAESIFDIGTERKNFVLSRLENFGLEKKININIDEFENEVNKLIDFTKKVNYKEEGGNK